MWMYDPKLEMFFSEILLNATIPDLSKNLVNRVCLVI